MVRPSASARYSLLKIRHLVSVALALSSFFYTATFCTATDVKTSPSTDAVTISHSDFHGWKSITLRNPVAEVVIVPEIARVMAFSLLDGAGHALPSPFWNNPSLDKNMPPDVEGWKNYGGDKAWPSPQADWPKTTGRPWPPPAGFDAVPFTAAIHGHSIVMTSPVDPSYGILIQRTIALDPAKPILSIKTTYEKRRGPPVRTGIWTITQLESPDRLFILLPPHSQFPQGYVNAPPLKPRDLKLDARILSLSRDPDNKLKIGTDGTALLWVGGVTDLLLESKPAEAGSPTDWPEQGSRSQVYTSPGDREKYVEFELLDRLHDLKIGQQASLEVIYTLMSRTLPDPAAEARRVFPQP